MAGAAMIHFNARVRGMKSGLLPASTLDEMLTSGDLNRMTDTLLDSAYRHELAESLTRRSGADAIEEAVSRNLVAVFHNLTLRAQGEQKDLVKLFLARWDLAAVKSLLRARHRNLNAAEAEASLLPGPGIPVALLHDLAASDSVEALVQGLTAWNLKLCGSLRHALPAYRENGDAVVFEEALDRRYFVQSCQELDALDSPDATRLRDLMSLEIDRINLRTLFQQIVSESGQGTPDAYLSKGSLPVQLLQEMAATNSQAGVIELLASTRYQSLAEQLYQLMQTKRFSPVERYLERLMMHEVLAMARQDVFGIGVVMDFAWKKYNEVVNLRLIARGLAGQLPAGRVREELHLV